MLTVHEFLSRLVTDAADRASFQEDPRAHLDQAGLAELSNADVVHAASLALDHAPVELVDEYFRTLPPALVQLAADGPGVDAHDLMPFLVNGPDDMELDMTTPDIFGPLGDVDSMLRGEASSTEDSNNSTEMTRTEDGGNGNESPVGNGNGNGNEVIGDVNTGDISGVAGDLNAGNIAGNGVTDVVGGVQDAVGGVQGGDVAGQLDGLTGQVGDIAGGDVTGGLQDLGGVAPDVQDVTGGLPVGDVAGGDVAGGDVAGGMTDLTAPLTGAEGPVGEEAGGGLHDVTGGLGL
ncbi:MULTISPECIES: IniB N-terminal domain-containing protein [unclassified Saccharopolyspora]|uniref:IniB N-terminal domain-containing protein n=1 Tax=Saccharopolyspora TaxID=1835 RepID=UPI00272B7F19|nr:IniB N-terminal domain-containing protein [Saccharopolyspora sp. HNM0986]